MMRTLLLCSLCFAPGAALAKSKAAPPPPLAEAPVAPPPDPLGPRPTVLAPAPFSPPTPSSTILGNGASVWAIPSGTLPLFTLVISTPGGSSLDPVGKEGTAAMGIECMQRGAGKLSAEAFAAEAERRGLSIEADAGPDGSYVMLSGSTDQLDAGLDLVAQMILRPKFTGAEVKKARELLLAGLASSMDEPAYVASRTALSLYWGAAHPYGRPADGTAAGIAKVSRGDIKRWHRAAWGSTGATITVAGNVEPALVVSALESRLGKAWKGRTLAALAPPAASIQTNEPIYLVDAPGSSQTGFYIAFPGLEAGSAATTATRAGTIALGGTFTSRLNSLLREKRAYTYGVRAALDQHRHGGTLVIRTRIRADVTGPALVDLLGELDGIREGITAEELGKAQGAFRQDIVQTLETVADTALAYSDPHDDRLPADTLATDLAAIGALPAESVTPAMAAYDPARAVFVLVGDVSVIRPQLEAAGFTKLSVVLPP